MSVLVQRRRIPGWWGCRGLARVGLAMLLAGGVVAVASGNAQTNDNNNGSVTTAPATTTAPAGAAASAPATQPADGTASPSPPASQPASMTPSEPPTSPETSKTNSGTIQAPSTAPATSSASTLPTTAPQTLKPKDESVAAPVEVSPIEEPAAPPAAARTLVEPFKLPFVRVSEKRNKFIALEIASRDFVRPDGDGPKVGLVAVAHIADASFYKSVQKLLDTYDLVLYESVKPAGAGGAHGRTDAERISSTRAALQYIGGLIEAYHREKDLYPPDIDTLSKFVAETDGRLAGWLDAAMQDAWGHRIVYQPKADSELGYELLSFGADGAAGGEGANADLALNDHPADPLQLKKNDNLQVQLADALGLKFQLVSLSYDKPCWRCSDMAMDELTRALAARGIDFGPIGGTLAGSSFPAKIIGFFLNLMKMADTFMEGQIADTFKVLLIQMLGDPAIMERGLLDQQMGVGFSEVIVQQRNQTALDQFKTIFENEKQIKSVAILYGAAHMPDMSSRLMSQFGYQPVPGPEGEHWMTAIKVDFTTSAVSPQDVAQIRAMMKQMLRP